MQYTLGMLNKLIKLLVELALFILGAALFVHVIRSVDLDSVFTLLAELGRWSWLIFLLYPFMCVWDVIAWKWSFPANLQKKLHFKELFLIRLAGESVNNITPFLDVGGEPLKIVLLERRFGLHRHSALAAVFVDRTGLFAGQILFMLSGLLIAMIVLPLPQRSEWALALSLFGSMVALASFIVVQKRQRLGLRIDKEVADYYRHQSVRMRHVVFYHMLGWIAGGIEMTIMLRCAGVPASWIDGFVLESLLQLVRTASFFIPGNLGAQEGGLAFFVQLMGFNPALGVVVSLFKRLRQMVWTALGFMVWALYEWSYLKHRALKIRYNRNS